jgi:DNA-binding IclR family transcriptional regulator
MTKTPEARRYTDLQGLGRALALLDEIAERPRRPKELADALGLKWTTAYRSLAFLRDSGYVRRDEATGTYSIGARLHSVGTAYLATHPIAQASRPLLRSTAEESNVTVQLVERDRDRTVVLAAAEPRTMAIPKATPGFHFPLHCGSKGHVLLAWAPEHEQATYLSGPLNAMTEASITEPRELAKRLVDVRAQGYAVTSRDVQLATGSVAAPIQDGSGEVSWCICLVTGVSDLELRQDALVETALHAAQSISLLAGWRPTVARS